MFCECCGGYKNVVENTMIFHFIEHGHIFECVEERMKCLDCGFVFETDIQLREISRRNDK